MKKDVRKMVLISLFIAMQIILTRFFAYENEIVRISFSFIPLAMCSIMFGPLWGGIAAALADVIGMMIFPKGSFFPGFTLTAFLTGVTYGLLLYKKPKNLLRVAIAVFITNFFLSLCLDTLWISILYNRAFIGFLLPRIVKNVIMMPIQVVMIIAIWRYVVARFEAAYV